MSDTIKTLSEFIAAAEKSRKYPTNSAYGMKAALKLFEPELKDQEKESVDVFQKRFEQIYQSVFAKNKARMSIASLETYKRRLVSLLRDYEKYGMDPSKMASWTRPIRRPYGKRIEKSSGIERQEAGVPEEPGVSSVKTEGPTMNRLEISLRPDARAILLLPSDLTSEEAEKIVGLVGFLAGNKKE